jgi:hypothetical protein
VSVGKKRVGQSGRKEQVLTICSLRHTQIFSLRHTQHTSRPFTFLQTSPPSDHVSPPFPGKGVLRAWVYGCMGNTASLCTFAYHAHSPLSTLPLPYSPSHPRPLPTLHHVSPFPGEYFFYSPLVDLSLTPLSVLLPLFSS